MKKLLMLLFGLGCLLAACQSKNSAKHGAQNPQREALHKETMAIHDEVMPRMSDIVRLKTHLQDLMMRTRMDEPTRKAYEKAADDLATAEKAMWDWMRDFKNPDEKAPDAEAIKYLESEKAKISGVRDAMLAAIGEAEILSKPSE